MRDKIVANLERSASPPTGEPSSAARQLVRTAYDLHVHVGPDVMTRVVDDITPAERAQVVERAVLGIDIVGTLTLNAAVGGLNPLAVEIAAREGARIVWLPTVDSVNEVDARDREYGEGVAKPLWARIQNELAEAGLAVPESPRTRSTR